MTEALPAGGDWEARGRLAWLLSLGVLDPAPDPILDTVAKLGRQWTGAAVSIALDSDGVAAVVAGDGAAVPGASAVPGVASSAPVEVLGWTVGEVRVTGVATEALSALSSCVADVLAQRLERLRRDDLGRPVAVVLVSPAAEILWVSPEFEPLLGRPADQWVGRSALDLLAPATAESSSAIFRQVAASPGRGGYVSHRLLVGSGEVVPFEIQSDNLLHDARLQAIALVLRSCPEHDKENTVLGDQIWVLNRLSAGVPLSEVLTRVVHMSERRDPNSHACVMRLGEDHSTLRLVLAPQLPEKVRAALGELRAGPHSPAGGATVYFGLPRFSSHLPDDEQWSSTRPILNEYGYEACWSLPIPAMEGSGQLGSLDVYRRVPGMPSEEESRLLLVAARLTAIAMEHESKTRRLRFSATHDPLTGLANRLLFSERLEAVSRGPIGVLFIDLDRFKLVNDTLGHTFGDELLRAVSTRLSEEVAEPAVVARFGGDEFTIFLPEVGSLDEVVAEGERLLTAVSRPYVVRDQPVTIGASAGATFTTEVPRDADGLVRDADTALYHAKERGRGRVEAFDARLLSALASRVEVEALLRAALDSATLSVDFQPEINIRTGLVVGAEALARCRTADGRLLAPSVFIPVAEEVGLITRVFEVVLQQSCKASSAWNAGRSEPIVVWVNLAPQQLGSPELVGQIASAIKAAGVPAATMGFEVTERGILPDPLEAARRLGELASLGVRLAVDDFGTGNSSLGYLQKLPFDTVKLDRSFVAGAVDDLRSRAIARAVVDLATAIGLSCVAEGVETISQLEVMRDLGCEVVQGHVYSPARPLAGLGSWMSETHGWEPSTAV